jgi:hypothetical protein
MSGRWLGLAAIVPVALVVLLGAGLTKSYGTGASLDTSPGWISDGAAPDTFWDSAIVDWPGMSLYTVRCHGQMRLEFQTGATGPDHGNPCYAAMGEDRGQSEELDAYATLGGGKVLWRHSVDGGPSDYYVGDEIYDNGPGRLPSAP